MAGDGETGVTIMAVTEDLDAGPIYLVGPRADPGRRHLRHAAPSASQTLSGDLLVRTLDEQPEPGEQPEEGVTYAEKITAADRTLDPARPAVELERVVRALTPHIGARVEWNGDAARRAPGPGRDSDGPLVLATAGRRARAARGPAAGRPPDGRGGLPARAPLMPRPPGASPSASCCASPSRGRSPTRRSTPRRRSSSRASARWRGSSRSGRSSDGGRSTTSSAQLTDGTQEARPAGARRAARSASCRSSSSTGSPTTPRSPRRSSWPSAPAAPGSSTPCCGGRRARGGRCSTRSTTRRVRHSIPDWLADALARRVRRRDRARADGAGERAARAGAAREPARRRRREEVAAAVGGRSPAEWPDAVVVDGPFDAHGHPLWHEGAYMPQSRSSQRVAPILDPPAGRARPRPLLGARRQGDPPRRADGRRGGGRRRRARRRAGRRSCGGRARGWARRACASRWATRREPRGDGAVRPRARRPAVLGPRDAAGQARPALADDARSGSRACSPSSARILAAAVAAVRPGGVVVWSTCTLNPAENEGLRSRGSHDRALTLFPHETRLSGLSR